MIANKELQNPTSAGLRVPLDLPRISCTKIQRFEIQYCKDAKTQGWENSFATLLPLQSAKMLTSIVVLAEALLLMTSIELIPVALARAK